MDTATTNTVKEELLSSDPVFRQLAGEHKKYEARLNELSALHYPSEEEQLEESILKKKKLAVKDQMHRMLAQNEQPGAIHH